MGIGPYQIFFFANYLLRNRKTYVSYVSDLHGKRMEL